MARSYYFSSQPLSIKMKKLKYIWLALAVIAFYNNAFSQTIKLYIDIAPSWHEKSMEYWSETKAYGKKTPTEIKAEILKNHRLLRDEFYLSLRESFRRQSFELVLIENPTELYLNQGDLYAELIVNADEVGGSFPYYYKNSMTGVANVNFELTVYDGEGRTEYNTTFIAKKILSLTFTKV